MKERPIIFSSESIQAILEGRKTQTRRVVTGKYVVESENRIYNAQDWLNKYPDRAKYIPRIYTIGDKLWVRETAMIVDREYSMIGHGWTYKIQYTDGKLSKYLWSVTDKEYPVGYKFNPIYMPRWASRITLEITDIRVERLQDINYQSLSGEGMYGELTNAYDRYTELWDSLNAKRGYPFISNPWVWVIEFKRLECDARKPASLS